MPVERYQWQRGFSAFPPWLCPTCHKGHLRIRKGTLQEHGDAASKKAEGGDEWDPTCQTGRFSALLGCDNPSCSETVSICGETAVEPDSVEDEPGEVNQVWATVYLPKAIYPAPHMIRIPYRCPSEVGDYLLSAFNLVWVDYRSTTNKFRMALESLLTERKIPVYKKTAKGKKREELSLHRRIELFKAKHAEAGECLEAVKWLGNHGSHHLGKLKLIDVFHAANILEHALELIYTTKVSPLKAAKKINKNKGPVHA